MSALKVGIKLNHKKGIAKVMKDYKRQQAQERQEAYAKKPLEEKLKHAGKKERAKLLAKTA